MGRILNGILIAATAWAVLGISYADSLPVLLPPVNLEADERLITILGTNDIHGGAEESRSRDGKYLLGGLARLAGAVDAIRQGVDAQWGARAGVVLLDAGDQFQGTLLSNFNEGQLIFSSMNITGYDAVVTGNHDYDFGPIGWLEDSVTASTPAGQDRDPRGALKRALSKVSFPLVSANTYMRDSLVDAKGAPIQVSAGGCSPAGGATIDWSQARRPDFLVPYLIKEVAGVRVAVIGIDHPETPSITTEANVTDLCFDDEARAYQRVRAELVGKADVFVALIHNGDTRTSFAVSSFVKKLNVGEVDAVVAGHTHHVNNARVGNVPIVQSGSGGTMFGRIHLVWNTQKGALVHAKTASLGGIELRAESCAPQTESFCQSKAVEGAPSQVFYHGVQVVPNLRIEKLITEGRKEVAALAELKLGVAKDVVTIDRTKESALANVLTDAMRALTGAQIAFMNTGGIRAPIPKGEVTYEALYRVLPFNTHAWTVGPMSQSQLLALLERSAQTCGAYGALMQSGLRVTYERNCKQTNGTDVDVKARVLDVQTLDGELIYSVNQPTMGIERTFTVATLDFLALGGAGYTGFSGIPFIRDLGILRESLKDYFTAKVPVQWSADLDGRWQEQERVISEAGSESFVPVKTLQAPEAEATRTPF